MKKLLLITFLFLITPDAKADMDYVCEVRFLEREGAFNFIEENCERNNILLFKGIPNLFLVNNIAYFCRKDREITFLRNDENDSTSDFTCVLYDNKPRKYILSD